MPRWAAPQGILASPAASSAQTASYVGNHRCSLDLHLPSSRGPSGTDRQLQAAKGMVSVQCWSLELKSRMKSTLNIVVERAVEPPCLRSAAIWHLHDGLQPSLYPCWISRPAEIPLKAGSKCQAESIAVKQSGRHTCWTPPGKTSVIVWS